MSGEFSAFRIFLIFKRRKDGQMNNKDQKFLCDISPGEKAVIGGLSAEGSMRRRLLDIGLTENTVVECVGKSPLGDPCAYLIRGAVIAIRKKDGKTVMIKNHGEAASWD